MCELCKLIIALYNIDAGGHLVGKVRLKRDYVTIQKSQQINQQKLDFLSYINTTPTITFILAPIFYFF